MLEPNVDREDVVRFEQSRERVLSDGLPLPALAPFGPPLPRQLQPFKSPEPALVVAETNESPHVW